MNNIIDRNESPSQMEPTRITESSRSYPELIELALELASQSSGFTNSLPKPLAPSIATLVRAMNCYYSNLIEGHNTHPIDIERSLENDYSKNPEKCNLQLEAKAHVTVQQWIDTGGLHGKATTEQAICEIHRRFTELLPKELLAAKHTDSNKNTQLTPGKLRQLDIKVGRHIAISPGAIPRFLEKFENSYTRLNKSNAIIAAAAAHHRLLWIHPFLDGNGRVTRLMSHATLLELLDTNGLWSIARGLSRNESTYKSHLANCDLPRRNDLDGRGNLSEEALTSFTKFFLETCIDQVNFMKELIQPDRLSIRVLLWAEEEIRLGILPPKSSQILEALLYKGELPRIDIPKITNLGERQNRRIISTLTSEHIITSENTHAPIKLAFPAKLAARWLPGLFPEK